ncbi:MAG: hypothetical protein E2O92_08100 [Alphaproteobacteria bacterium]|nr:MAG: hypothetical protein E2O92_08100 [Alphaproteobacteria bacterium]
MNLHEDVAPQLDDLHLVVDRPLIISDADEVLVQFAAGLDSFLRDQGLYYDISSFAITGNVRRQDDNEAISGDDVQALLKAFFRERTEHLPAVPGAAEALKSLSKDAQIIVVSNVPVDQRDARIRGLKKIGIDVPVIANIGLKGVVVREIASQIDAPVYFLDDIPHNIASVAEHAADVHRIHFVADPRLARLIDPAQDCHTRIDDWPSAETYIRDHMRSKGY